MKTLKLVLAAVVVLIIVSVISLAFILNYLLNGAIKTGVETGLPPLTGTTVSVAEVDISPFSGKGTIKNFVLGNPAGFKTASSIKVGTFTLELEPKSLAGEVIIIKEIVIKRAELTFEYNLKNRASNFAKIISNIEEFVGAGEKSGSTEPEVEPGAKPAEDTRGGKKVIIERFLMAEGKVQLSASIAKGKTAVIPLPQIELLDIGKKSNGETANEAALQIFRKIGLVVRGVVAENSGLKKVLSSKVSAVLKKNQGKIDKIMQQPAIKKATAGVKDFLKRKFGTK